MNSIVCQWEEHQLRPQDEYWLQAKEGFTEDQIEQLRDVESIIMTGRVVDSFVVEQPDGGYECMIVVDTYGGRIFKASKVRLYTDM
jgi:hypothetical protein